MKNGFSIAWKTAAAALVSYSLVAGLMSPVPRLFILNETIRNLYFHVPMWFTMVALMGVSLGYSIGSLRKPGIAALESDRKARLAAEVALVFAFLGLFTGMIWARFTWGAYWTNDPKLNGTAVAILIYLAYFVLRSSVEDPEKKARDSRIHLLSAAPELNRPPYRVSSIENVRRRLSRPVHGCDWQCASTAMWCVADEARCRGEVCRGTYITRTTLPARLLAVPSRTYELGRRRLKKASGVIPVLRSWWTRQLAGSVALRLPAIAR